MTANQKQQHGGVRPGAGRKPRHGTRMPQKTVRLPQEWIDELIEKYGSFQEAIEELVVADIVDSKLPD